MIPVYREPGVRSQEEPVQESPKPCYACHLSDGVRHWYFQMVSRVYGAGTEKFRYICEACGDIWD